MGSSILIIFVPLYYLFNLLGVDPFPFLESNKELLMQGSAWLEKLIAPLLDFLVSIGIGSFG